MKYFIRNDRFDGKKVSTPLRDPRLGAGVNLVSSKILPSEVLFKKFISLKLKVLSLTMKHEKR